MPRVVGIDAGTVSLDVCGLADGRLTLDLSWPTADAVADPDGFLAALTQSGRPDLVVGPSGYGLPLTPAAEASDEDLRLAFLAGPDERGGIGGLRRFVRRLADSGLPVVLTPGVIHLDSVPVHRKLNRVDLGTADKVCAAALAIESRQRDSGRALDDISLILLELGGAFTAAVAVDRGRIVDGLGGTSGPMGWRSAGALDGEVAYLAGNVEKAMLFGGGAETVAESAGRALAIAAYVEGAAKAVRQLAVSVPGVDQVVVSGRSAADADLVRRLADATGRNVGGASGRIFARRQAGSARGGASGRRTGGGTARGAGRASRYSGGARYGARSSLRHHFGNSPPPVGSRPRCLKSPAAWWWRVSRRAPWRCRPRARVGT